MYILLLVDIDDDLKMFFNRVPELLAHLSVYA